MNIKKASLLFGLHKKITDEKFSAYANYTYVHISTSTYMYMIHDFI